MKRVDPRKMIVSLFAAAVLEVEAIPHADLNILADHLKQIGIPRVLVDIPDEKIVIDPISYNKTMEKLVQVIPHIPDIYKLTWRAGDTSATLYESYEGWTEEVKQEALSCARIFN